MEFIEYNSVMSSNHLEARHPLHFRVAVPTNLETKTRKARSVGENSHGLVIRTDCSRVLPIAKSEVKCDILLRALFGEQVPVLLQLSDAKNRLQGCEKSTCRKNARVGITQKWWVWIELKWFGCVTVHISYRSFSFPQLLCLR